jgi:hypothetical protein
VRSHQSEATGEIRFEDPMRVHTAARCCQFTQPRVHHPHKLGTQTRIFGEIDASSSASDQIVQPIKKRRESYRANGKVKGQRPSLHREGKRPRNAGTESLEHGHRRSDSRCGNHRDRCADEFDVGRSDNELILHESTLAIEEIPIRHSIQRIQKRGQRDESAASASWRLAKPGLIEYARGA